METYKAEDFIAFIESGRRDKVSESGLLLIAKRFRELEKNQIPEKSKSGLYKGNIGNKSDLDVCKLCSFESSCPPDIFEKCKTELLPTEYYL